MRYALLALALTTLAAAGCRHNLCYKRSVVEYRAAPPHLPAAYYPPPPACP